VKIFDQTAALVGMSEKTAIRSGVAYRKIYIHPADHATYYPRAAQMSLKVLFDPTTGRLLGAQAVGGSGVDKRIDVLSIAIQKGMTVFDLEEAELAYAPQFGSAKDPINMVGFVAGGLLRGDHPQIVVESILAAAPDTGPLLLDVRRPEEFARGYIPRAKNIPIDELRTRLHELPRDRQVATYCQVGQRGYVATRILRQRGINAVNIAGGYKTYRLFRPDGGSES
jgi:rhodanese-related sulfurtransferase